VALQGDQVRRYARHVLLPDVGGVGQERLLAATVAIDVADRAARAAFDYLVAAGVGTLAVIGGGDELIAHAAALNPDVRVIAVADRAHAPAGAIGFDAGAPDASTDLASELVRGGAAATVLLHRLATHPE
jgi:hypothetical protein